MDSCSSPINTHVEKLLERLKKACKNRFRGPRFRASMLDTKTLSILKNTKPLNNALIDCFSEILMTQPFSAFKLSCEQFIAERYMLDSNAFKVRARSVLNQTIILDSEFIPTLFKMKSQHFHNADLWIIKMINKYSRDTIRQIIMPLCIGGTWMLICIELYSMQLRIYNPLKGCKIDMSKYLVRVQEYIKCSEWFQHNYNIVKTDFNPNGDINILEIKEIPSAYLLDKNDSGVMVCLYMYSLCQGIKPINIDMFSKRRRGVLYKVFRDSTISKIECLFYEESQSILKKMNG